jgi:hypothetical protein
MVKRSKVHTKKKKAISTKKLAIISAFTALIIISTAFYFFSEKNDVFSLKAVIVDQLAKDHSNPSFVENVTDLLEGKGFKVEYYCNETIDVSFFKSLAERRFGIIIFRVHTALRQDGSTVDLFTNEKWDSQKYGQEWERGLIVYGNYSNDPNLYCAITSRFIERLSGSFPKSIVFAMGCWSLKEGCEQLANAFIKKGAKAYIGWTDVILPEDTDNETLSLLKMLLDYDYTLGDAVNKTRTYNYTGVSPGGTQVPVTSRLRLFTESPEVRNLKLSELIAEANRASTHSMISNLKITNSIFQTQARRKVFSFKHIDQFIEILGV